MSRVNAISCASWVPKGKAKENPDKVEITKEELTKIIKETQGDLDDLEESLAEDGEENQDDDEMSNSNTEDKENTEEAEMEDVTESLKTKINLDDEINDLYNLEEYDKDAGESMVAAGLGKYIVLNEELEEHKMDEDESDNESEEGNNKILPNDNLIAIGHVDGDAAILEIHVYNSDEGSFYVHHDLLLPSPPMCMEWLNYDPSDENGKGNLLAVGTMSNIIQVWDLDLVDGLDPMLKLGKKRSANKRKIKNPGHKDAVLSLSWNEEFHHILASGSVDKSVILWDLASGNEASKLTCFEEKIQALQWNPFDPHCLLTGSADGIVKSFDFRGEQNTHKSWKLEGEVECVEWQKQQSHQDEFLVSTDAGQVYLIDRRADKIRWSVKAHEEGITGLKLSSQCPGCLVTSSTDNTIKIWDIANNDEPVFVQKHNPKIGVILTLTTSPDDPFVFFMGGDNGEYNQKVLDIRSLGVKVRGTFCERVNLPADLDASDKEQEDDEDEEENKPLKPKFVNSHASVVEECESKGWKPKKTKSKKKKGGHIGKKKRKA